MGKIILFLLLSASALAQGISIPDANLKNVLLNVPNVAVGIDGNFLTIDANTDGQIDLAEAAQVVELRLNAKNISSLQGLEHFHSLRQLNAMMNLNMGAVDMTGFVNLETLQIGLSGITSINVTGLTNLKVLDLYGNNLTTLDVSTLTGLDLLDTYENQNLSFINFGSISNVKQLLVGNNPLTALHVENFTGLVQLECVDTNVDNLDLSHCPGLNFIIINDNPLLTSINLKNIDTNNYSYTGNNALDNVCADAAKVNELQAYFAGIGQTAVNVNSNCNLSVDEVDGLNAMIYPNPATDHVTINFGAVVHWVRVYAPDGRLLENEQPHTSSFNLNVSNLPVGTYIIKLSSGKGTASLKLMKQ